ncbi:MobB family relaxase [Arenibacter latericius]|uniref:MobB family relaxase n=1 Tax=Arenibacter latericius TaxID=86104 RepID=UPI0004134307|nr:MobB family relaxase [Arenibacter latericius]
MYITITAQKLGNTFSPSSADFVDYLGKENQGMEEGDENMEYFFNQYNDQISAEEVVREIDGNTAKLEKSEPRFYSITINPSKYELKALNNPNVDLKLYTRELMKDYVASFNRKINGRAVSIDDIKYYAKIEHQRTFKGTDKQIRENQPYATKILQLKHNIEKVENGTLKGSIKKMERRIKKLERQAPHQQNGQRIVQDMVKAGSQSHIHIVMSRKDASNSYSLSPGSKYKASDTELNGQIVRRGFNRDLFFDKAEKTFDRTFGYQRSFTEKYSSRKEFINNPRMYFNSIIRLPTNERAIALKVLRETGLPIMGSIPVNKVQIALKAFNKLRQGVEIAIKSSSIGI